MLNYKKLIYCIFFDLVGLLSFIPYIGWLSDIIWAPISAGIMLKMFGTNNKGKLGAVISFVEEILPFTDVIPTFTLFWIYESFFEKKNSNSKAHSLLKQ